jgi:hypothetical protein
MADGDREEPPIGDIVENWLQNSKQEKAREDTPIDSTPLADEAEVWLKQTPNSELTNVPEQDSTTFKVAAGNLISSFSLIVEAMRRSPEPFLKEYITPNQEYPGYVRSESTTITLSKDQANPTNFRYSLNSAANLRAFADEPPFGFYDQERVQRLKEELDRQGVETQIADYNNGHNTGLIANYGDRVVVIELGSKSRKDWYQSKEEKLAGLEPEERERRLSGVNSAPINPLVTVGMTSSNAQFSLGDGYLDAAILLEDEDTFRRNISFYADMYGKVLTAIDREQGAKGDNQTIQFSSISTKLGSEEHYHS